MHSQSNPRSFSLEIPLPYEQALLATQALSLIRGDYDQLFPNGPQPEDSPPLARTADALIAALREHDDEDEFAYSDLVHGILANDTEPQQKLAELKPALHVARSGVDPMTVRLSSRGGTAIATAIAVIQVCQKELGAPSIGFTFEDELSPTGATGVAVAPGQEAVAFHAAPTPDPLFGLEQECLSEMNRQQQRHEFDLTHEDDRAELVEKAINEVMWATPLYEKLQTIAKRWGVRPASRPQPGATTEAAESAGMDGGP